MRLQLATLIAAGLVGAATVASAQTPPMPPAQPGTPAPAATPAAPPVPGAMAPATQTPATPAPATDPSAVPATPATPGAPATDAAGQPVAAAPQTLPLPTSGDGYEVINVLNAICEPGVKPGGDTDALAKAAGFKKTRDNWVKVMGAKPYTITLDFRSGANPTVCNMTLDYATGGAQTIVDALNAWAYDHEPFLKFYRNDEYNNATFIGRTVSWEHNAVPGVDTQHIGLVFVGKKKPDGTPFSKVGDQATVLYQSQVQAQ